jgi:hypothetical protein
MPDGLYGPRYVGGRFAGDQAEIAAAGWAGYVSQGIGIHHLNRTMAVGTTDVHGQPRDDPRTGADRMRDLPVYKGKYIIALPCIKIVEHLEHPRLVASRNLAGGCRVSRCLGLPIQAAARTHGPNVRRGQGGGSGRCPVALC